MGRLEKYMIIMVCQVLVALMVSLMKLIIIIIIEVLSSNMYESESRILEKGLR